MQHYPDDFVPTGNNVPVSAEDLVKYVHMELDRYDNLVQMAGSVPQYSPYTHPIIFTTEDGKQVQIPENIQQEAVKVWNDFKGKQISEKNDEYAQAQQQYEDLQESPYGRESPQNNSSQETKINQESFPDQEAMAESAQAQSAPFAKPIQPIQPSNLMQTASMNQYNQYSRDDGTFLYLILAIAFILIIYYCYKNNKFDNVHAAINRFRGN